MRGKKKVYIAAELSYWICAGNVWFCPSRFLNFLKNTEQEWGVLMHQLGDPLTGVGNPSPLYFLPQPKLYEQSNCCVQDNQAYSGELLRLLRRVD